MIPIVDNELDYLDFLEIEFPKDFKGGDSIRNNWAYNMQHFCDNFTPLKGKFTTEELLILKLDEDHYLQGYTDLIKHNDDGSKSIFDWKTSGLYKGKDLEHAAHQLVIYGMALESAGERVKDLAWIFMKYVQVTFMGKKTARSKEKTKITKVIERRKIGQELRKYVEEDLHDAGYDEIDIDFYISELINTNSLVHLPDEVKSGYGMNTYVLRTEFNEESKAKTTQYIWDMINEFERRGDSESEWEHREFETTTKTGKKTPDVFYCNSLCSYGHVCRHIQVYNNRCSSGLSDDIAGLF